MSGRYEFDDVPLATEAEMVHGTLLQALRLEGEERERELREAESAMEALLHRIKAMEG